MNIIEKVANEIQLTSRVLTGSNLGSNECVAYAKTAIEAMREPSEEMVFAMMGFETDINHPAYQLYVESYKSAIDIALKE